ncbi:hypothetical protein GGR55DRAFT_628921 [Xylaria sp. FL0064]|nr:hypothetical protein GGR55DRAFT_628921 [Xylaria sp. FL0064]
MRYMVLLVLHALEQPDGAPLLSHVPTVHWTSCLRVGVRLPEGVGIPYTQSRFENAIVTGFASYKQQHALYVGCTAAYTILWHEELVTRVNVCLLSANNCTSVGCKCTWKNEQ